MKKERSKLSLNILSLISFKGLVECLQFADSALHGADVAVNPADTNLVYILV